jgi:hypothetical protein
MTHHLLFAPASPASAPPTLLLAWPEKKRAPVGRSVTMKQGDIVIMRGVTHNWKNRSTIPAVTAIILIDAAPFEAGGEKKGTLYPA